MTYTISPLPSLLAHGQLPQPVSFVADVDAASSDDGLSYMAVEARLRSGDYFVTLATELEKLAQLLDGQGVPEATALELLAGEITYLDKHYRLSAK